MVALLVLMASAAHASPLEEGPLALRRSQGRGRDNPKCIEPPPPLRGDLSAQRKSGEAAPSHLKYLALDGSTDTAQSDWTNLGFIGPTPAGTVNETELQTYLDLGYDMFLSMQGITVQTCIWGTNAEVVHSVASTPPSPFKSTERRPATAHSPLCPERWQAAWTGPNATVGGIWNNSIEKLAKEKKLIGVYLGDELLGGGLTVSNLTAITKMVKAVWPEGIVYYNEEWTPFNDPDWKDSEGQVSTALAPHAPLRGPGNPPPTRAPCFGRCLCCPCSCSCSCSCSCFFSARYLACSAAPSAQRPRLCVSCVRPALRQGTTDARLDLVRLLPPQQRLMAAAHVRV